MFNSSIMYYPIQHISSCVFKFYLFLQKVASALLIAMHTQVSIRTLKSMLTKIHANSLKNLLSPNIFYTKYNVYSKLISLVSTDVGMIGYQESSL